MSGIERAPRVFATIRRYRHDPGATIVGPLDAAGEGGLCASEFLSDEDLGIGSEWERIDESGYLAIDESFAVRRATAYVGDGESGDEYLPGGVVELTELDGTLRTIENAEIIEIEALSPEPEQGVAL